MFNVKVLVKSCTSGGKNNNRVTCIQRLSNHKFEGRGTMTYLESRDNNSL